MAEKKDAAAQALARKRWKKTTAKQRLAIGAALTEARTNGTTAKQRSAQAKRAAAARWKKPKSTGTAPDIPD